MAELSLKNNFSSPKIHQFLGFQMQWQKNKRLIKWLKNTLKYIYIQLKSLFIKDLYLKAKNYIMQACKNPKYINLSEWQT